ncbi:DUF2460 domain-containing protein [Luteithermobacter gelatinilyticus]|uniref:DUF2460 domain-containing protein n=1 Tax=Luteithermobacter gelatinilyticus TaxID=2582913 RepID=UPI0011067A60|nr:DUF2460 domain-containing protein [Luteithermobacter gelatinilyticus]
MFWLASPQDQEEITYIRRFTPRYWSVNFPRPMMGSVVTTGPDSLKVNVLFYRKEDLCGLIWDSEDREDHPLLAHETKRDYSNTILSFRWQSTGLVSLEALHGATLTIEGRDATGSARVWYVRLANYATGTGEDAEIILDFDNLDGGFTLPAEADPVWPGDIDRLFISLVPSEYNGVDTGPLAIPESAEVSLSDIRVSGGTSTLKLGDGYVRPHDVRLANGYDDAYHLTPERVIWSMLHLGYRDIITHYVGMSHYFSLAWDGSAYRVDPARDRLNAPARIWHQDFLARAQYFGFEVILSLSYELLAEYAPDDWQQLAHDGSPARTGWAPPSTLLPPTHTAAMTYLKEVFLELADLQVAAGMAVKLQIGEPWWWISLGPASSVPHFYDPATTALYTAETGLSVPARHQLATESYTADQEAYLVWLGEKLAASTLMIRDAVKAVHATADVGLLFYTPQVLLNEAPMAALANFPAGSWQWPAFDFFQIEDYDHVIDAAWKDHERGLAMVMSSLAYPMERLHYFSGFNLTAGNPEIWRNMDRAIRDGRSRSFEQVFVWAWPQVVRDGFVYNQEQDQDMSGFHEVQFPTDIGYGASGGPVFSTQVVEMASGHEQRIQEWAEPRLVFEVGTALRSEDDLAELLAFFRARAGRAYGFRFKDWSDYKSCPPGTDVRAQDQVIGVGDGLETDFYLIKTYQSGAENQVRRIHKPVVGTVRVALDGAEQLTGWTVEETTGLVRFDVPPATGVTITTGFEFDVPVRFAEDSLALTLETFRAGQVPQISLIEVRLA